MPVTKFLFTFPHPVSHSSSDEKQYHYHLWGPKMTTGQTANRIMSGQAVMEGMEGYKSVDSWLLDGSSSLNKAYLTAKFMGNRNPPPTSPRNAALPTKLGRVFTPSSCHS